MHEPQPDSAGLPPADATPNPTSPEEAAVLDVHPAHHAATSWKEFFVHIATIVLGLLVAVGLEQAVESIHHGHQIRDMESTLRAEDVENQTIIAFDMQAVDGAVATTNGAIAALQTPAPASGPAPMQQPPEVNLFIPGDSAWLAARDSGLLALAPRSLVDNYWKVYRVQDVTASQVRAAYGDLDRIQALASLHVSASSLSPADRDSMLVAYANYRESLKVLKIDLDMLNRATGLALSDQTVDAKSIYKM
jgi:hypothetical protein